MGWRPAGHRPPPPVAPDEGHGFAREATLVEYQARVARFLERALEGGAAAR